MRLLVVDQCSASKAVDSDPERTRLADLDAPDDTEQVSEERIVARDLYTGKQQRRIGNAVQTFRKNGHDVDRYFVSAGFGVVSETEPLPPYDATFSTMSAGEIQQRSRELSITDDLVDVVDTPYDLVFFALGADYYRAIDLGRVLRVLDGTTTVLFNRETEEERWEHVISIPARTEQARENGSTVIGLKGTYLERFASRLESGSPPVSREQIRVMITTTDNAGTTIDDF